MGGLQTASAGGSAIGARNRSGHSIIVQRPNDNGCKERTGVRKRSISATLVHATYAGQTDQSNFSNLKECRQFLRDFDWGFPMQVVAKFGIAPV